MNRRELFSTLAAAAAIGAGQSAAEAQSQAATRQMKALPFDPKKLRAFRND